ncbi:MAG: 50S ribosomal protein L6 [bacterium]|nr:50S ribosomal protein L6 [bacterium]
MSRIGKKTILIPESVTTELKGQVLKIKGPKGELDLKILPDVNVEIKDNKEINVSLKRQTKQNKPLWGLFRALIANNVLGVSEGFKKQLEIRGLGYKAEISGNDLILNVGFSHPVKISKPQGIEISIDNKIITISGADKQLVGQVAADIRKVKAPEPYKGKGIRYLGEKVRKKVGKKAVASA